MSSSQRCWRCGQVKPGIKLCADDLLCPECDRDNEEALAKIRNQQVSDTSTRANSKTTKPAKRTNADRSVKAKPTGSQNSRTTTPVTAKPVDKRNATTKDDAGKSQNKPSSNTNANSSASVPATAVGVNDCSVLDYCAMCKEPADDRSIRCDICHSLVHGMCCSISDNVVDKLLDIVQYAGWVCLDCRDVQRNRIIKLQISLAEVTEKLSDVLVKVAALESKLASSISAGPDVPHFPRNAKSEPKNENAITIAMEVHKTLADKSKRRQNIVVTGLPEPEPQSRNNNFTAQDEQAFMSLCEDHFSTKPALSHLGCRRLGKISDMSTDRKPRKLLVHLASESSANDLLTEAKLLRDSDDPHIAANVFINRDLSQVEAKLAFEQRQRRRAVQQRNAQRTQEHVDNSVGASINSVAGDTDAHHLRKEPTQQDTTDTSMNGLDPPAQTPHHSFRTT